MSILKTILTSILPGHSVAVPPMPDFDVQRYLGDWYEIARLDNWFEKGLRKVYARYVLNPDGSISVTNGGYDAITGERREARARAVPGKVPNSLKVYFVPLVFGRYEVAFLDADYSRAVVAGGSLDYLWLLARAPQIDDNALQPMLQAARALGYDTDKLIYTGNFHGCSR